MKLYGDLQSGNCYKVKLACALLDLSHEWVHVDILAGDTRTDQFLAKNPNGKIPLLELPNGQVLSESNAILNFLAADTALMPSDPFEWAKVLEWQFFEQYSHEPYIAVARFIAKYLGLPEDKQSEYESKQAGGHRALAVMDQHLSNSPFLVGNTLSIADISLYAYTHVADEGGFDLADYPNIQRWLSDVAASPGFFPMPKGER